VGSILIDNASAPVKTRRQWSVTAAANEEKFTGGMIALIPTDADIARLALDGEEPPEDLHLTLWYLGDEEINIAHQLRILHGVVHAVEGMPIMHGNAFGAAHWNPESEHPAWVLNVGDANEDDVWNLAHVRGSIISQIIGFDMPEQHTPWQPHICIAYSSDDLLDELSSRTGPVTFDRVRIAFGHEITDIKLYDDSVVTAAGKKSGDNNNLKDYWTKDPRGLAKWVDKPHPWTELYGHLKKFMPDEMAKRVASEWYHEVKGH
jgi:2'-5' RNA ligase